MGTKTNPGEFHKEFKSGVIEGLQQAGRVIADYFKYSPCTCIGLSPDEHFATCPIMARKELLARLPQADKEPANETIGEVIRRGTIPCPRCDRILLVDTKGNVTQCNRCGDEAFVYWNVFVLAK